MTHPVHLVVGETGYLSPTSGAAHFFPPINRCSGRASTVLSPNKGLEGWGRIPGHDTMAAGLLDRVAPPPPRRQRFREGYAMSPASCPAPVATLPPRGAARKVGHL